MSCLVCPTAAAPVPEPSPPLIDSGTAGRSARQEQARCQVKREAELKDRWGNRLGGLINRFADEPQSIRAWGLGAHGEELLGAALAKVPDLVVLNDRKVAGTKGNIDHIAIGPAGVFVIDAKYYEGLIEVVNKGGWFSADWRLTVGGRNKSNLTENMGWQVKAVTKALMDAGVDPLPPVTSVLCFVDGNWPFFRPPKAFEGVLLESERSIVKVLGAPIVLGRPDIDRIAHVLADALPAK
jgi:Nuclease-related domain.